MILQQVIVRIWLEHFGMKQYKGEDKMGYKITSAKKNIVAVSGTNNDVAFHNQLFETDDCVIEYFEDPTPEQIAQSRIEAEAVSLLNQQRQVIKDQLKEVDSKSIRALRTNDIERLKNLELEAVELRIKLLHEIKQ